MNERRHYRGGFVWPIILIGAGIVFLLNNLGMVGWSVWETLLRLWPVLLIAVGLDILVGRRFPLGSALLGLLLVVVLVLTVSGAVPQTMVASAVVVARTEAISEDLKGNERATVEIRFGTGNLNVNALTEGSSQLIRGSVDLSPNESLNKNYSGSNGAAHYTLESRGSLVIGPVLSTNNQKKWNLGLNRDVPLDLRISSGASQSILDLTGLNVTRFELNGGVGQVTVKLPVRGSYTGQIDSGVGQMIIMAPQGLAARVLIESGLGGVDAPGFQKSGKYYTIGNYNTAENRADIKVTAGVGQIVLKTLSE